MVLQGELDTPAPLQAGTPSPPLRLPDPGPRSHLGGGPVHPAFRARVHVDEDEALHHLGVVQLQFKTRREREDPATCDAVTLKSNQRQKRTRRQPVWAPRADCCSQQPCPVSCKTDVPAQQTLNWVSEGGKRKLQEK